MTVRINNFTGLDIYYRVLDYEGPFASFKEDILPGMYPGGQDTYTDSDIYYSGLDTAVGAQRYTLSSRYPRFNASTEFMNSNFAQQPSHRSYDELKYNYPSPSADSLRELGIRGDRILDSNHEGVIKSGFYRDLMLKDINCNIRFETIGKPRAKPVDYEHADFSGLSLAPGEILNNNQLSQVTDPNDPRYGKYYATIKVARLKETNVYLAIADATTYYLYNQFGMRVKPSFPGGYTIIPMYKLGNAPAFKRVGIDTLPAAKGTYIGALYQRYLENKKRFLAANPYTNSYNYSKDYDEPVLGYFDRRFLYNNPYKGAKKYI